jgi:dTDP-4-dehydrorhamnose reductase
MKTIILGASGLLGRHIAAQWAQIEGMQCLTPSHAELDLCDHAAVVAYIAQHPSALVINCTAYSAVDAAENEPNLAAALNHHAVASLVRACDAASASLVHFSTDFVFDGLQNGTNATRPYTEDDAPHPLGIYGATKLAGERAVLASSGAHYVFRVSWLYGLGGQNFFSQVADWLQQDRHLRIVSDQVSVPNDAARLAQALVQWQALWAGLGGADRAQFLQQHRGLYHVVGGAAMSRLDYAQQVAKALGSKAIARIEGVPASTFAAVAQRPGYSAMSADKFARVFGIVI